MDDKDKHDCFAKQAELAFNSFNARRENQWKISVGLWAMILLSTQFLFRLAPIGNIWPCLLVSIVIILLHGAFLVGVWRQNAFDSDVARFARDMCAELAYGSGFEQPRRLPRRVTIVGSWRWIQSGSSNFQFATTVVLLAVSVIVLNTMHPTK